MHFMHIQAQAEAVHAFFKYGYLCLLRAHTLKHAQMLTINNARPSLRLIHSLIIYHTTTANIRDKLWVSECEYIRIRILLLYAQCECNTIFKFMQRKKKIREELTIQLHGKRYYLYLHNMIPSPSFACSLNKGNVVCMNV